MFKNNEYQTITSLLIRNIEIIEFDNRLSDEFNENFKMIEEITYDSLILKEETTFILKLKMIAELTIEFDKSLDIVKRILIILLEVNEFKNMIEDNYGISKSGYWSFRKDFRTKELELSKLESEFYLSLDNNDNFTNSDDFNELSLKFKKSLDKTNRRGWL